MFVVEGGVKDEEDEVLFWIETKAKLRVATETHLRLMIKQTPLRQNKSNRERDFWLTYQRRLECKLHIFLTFLLPPFPFSPEFFRQVTDV